MCLGEGVSECRAQLEYLGEDGVCASDQRRWKRGNLPMVPGGRGGMSSASLLAFRFATLAALAVWYFIASTSRQCVRGEPADEKSWLICVATEEPPELDDLIG